MIPYVHIHPIEIGGLELSPFGIMMGMAIIVGAELSLWRGRWLGVDSRELGYFVCMVIFFGIAGAHVFDSIFYYPAEVLRRPLILLELWNGLSSFGGFLGAFLGALVWKYFGLRLKRRATPASILSFTDILVAVAPFWWILGRMGCALVHDHMGVLAPAGSWLAVADGPGPVWDFGFFDLQFGTQPRYDLGLLEMMLTIPLAAGFALTWRRCGASGWYVVAASLLYSPMRFALDFLRLDDSASGDLRYAGLTPAQWACFMLFSFGIGLAIHIYRQRRMRWSGV